MAKVVGTSESEHRRSPTVGSKVKFVRNENQLFVK